MPAMSNDNQSAVAVPQPVASQKPHRSPSQLNTYFRCGEFWRRYYLENERYPANLGMLKGTGMHRGAQYNFEQKIESHADLPMAQIVDAAVAAYDSELSKGVTLTDDEAAMGPGVATGQARDDVARLAAAFSHMQAPDYQPIAVEKMVRIPVPRGTHDLLGIMDMVAYDLSQNRKLVVNDFKNSKRKKTATDAAESTQLTFYAAAHQVEYGEPAAEVRLDVLVLTKTKGVQRQVLAEQRDKADFQVLANRLNVMEQGVKAGVFLPAMPGSWWCSKNSCPYWANHSCAFVNSQRIEAAREAEDAT